MIKSLICIYLYFCCMFWVFINSITMSHFWNTDSESFWHTHVWLTVAETDDVMTEYLWVVNRFLRVMRGNFTLQIICTVSDVWWITHLLSLSDAVWHDLCFISVCFSHVCKMRKNQFKAWPVNAIKSVNDILSSLWDC